MNKYKYRILKNGNGKYKAQVKRDSFWADWDDLMSAESVLSDQPQVWKLSLFDSYEEAEEKIKEVLSRLKKEEKEAKRQNDWKEEEDL